jgi:hypothetical protein
MQDLLNNNDSKNNIILIISCGKRFKTFKKTLDKLYKYNPQINNDIKKCWILDDRSSAEDKKEIDITLKKYFLDNYNTIHFNSDKKHYYINKLNFISKISNSNDIVFFLEDDWECSRPLELDKHINILKNNDVDSICLTGQKHIQPKNILNSEQKYKEYWKNPWPNTFRHVISYEPNQTYIYKWVEVLMKNWSNNPNLTKAKIYHQGFFEYNSHYEVGFADKFGSKINQYFSNDLYFHHIGNDNSLEEKQRSQ